MGLKSGHACADNLVHDPLMPCEGSWEPCTVIKSVANRCLGGVIVRVRPLTRTIDLVTGREAMPVHGSRKAQFSSLVISANTLTSLSSTSQTRPGSLSNVTL